MHQREQLANSLGHVHISDYAQIREVNPVLH